VRQEKKILNIMTNLKELIEEIVERVSYYQMGKQEQWTGEYTHFMSPAQATTDILKAIRESQKNKHSEHFVESWCNTCNESID